MTDVYWIPDGVPDSAARIAQTMFDAVLAPGEFKDGSRMSGERLTMLCMASLCVAAPLVATAMRAAGSVDRKHASAVLTEMMGTLVAFVGEAYGETRVEFDAPAGETDKATLH